MRFKFIFTILLCFISSHAFCCAHFIFLRDTWRLYFLAHHLKVECFIERSIISFVCVKAIQSSWSDSGVTYEVAGKSHRKVGDEVQGMEE